MNRPLASLLPLLCACAAPAQDLWIRAGTLVLAPDVVLRNEGLLVRGDKVVYAGRDVPEDAKAKATAVDLAQSWVVPAFACAHGHLSLVNDLAERAEALTPDLLAADTFDPFDPQLKHVAASGIAWLGLAPSSANTIGGIAAVVRCGTPGSVAVEATYLKLGLSQEAFDPNRQPTSLIGAADLLRTKLQGARAAGAGSGTAGSVLRDALSGARRCVVTARTHAEITTVCELCEAFGIAPTLVDADEAEKSLPRLAALKAQFILAPLTLDSKRQALRLPALLEAQKAPFSFRAERGEQLRLSAALALRNGLSRQGALAALTRVPSEQCGAPALAGQLRAGGRADFLVFSGDPLDLTSRLEAVWLGGKRISPEGGAQ
jgi:imidazolonepropionase-like amidohydrolase